MTATARVLILALCCFINVQLFEFTNFIVLTQEYCQDWPQSFWFDSSKGISPFWSFSLLFFVALLWCIAEWIVLRIEKTDRIIRFVLLLSITLLLTVVALMQSVHWQALQVFAGKRSYEEFWPMLIDLEKVRFAGDLNPNPGLNWRYRGYVREQKYHQNFSEGPPGWMTFTWKNTCAKGIEISSLSEQEWSELNEEFNQMWESYYQEREVERIRKELHKQFGIDSN